MGNAFGVVRVRTETISCSDVLWPDLCGAKLEGRQGVLGTRVTSLPFTALHLVRLGEIEEWRGSDLGPYLGPCVLLEIKL